MVDLHAVLVAPGAEVSAGRVTRQGGLEPPTGYQPWLVAWAGRGSDGHAYAVSLTEDVRTAVEVSPNVRFGGDGAAYRRWWGTESAEGWSVTDLGIRPDLAVGIRLEVEGYGARTGVAWLDGEPGRTPVLLRGDGAATYAGPRPRLLAQGVRLQTQAIMGTNVVRGKVIWSGPVHADDPAAVVLVTRPDTVRLQTFVSQERGSSVMHGTRAVPSDEPDESPWLLEPRSRREPTLLICPSRPASVSYRPRRGPARTLSVPASGVAVLEPPGAGRHRARGATVTLRNEEGLAVLTSVLRSVEPFSLLATGL